MVIQPIIYDSVERNVYEDESAILEDLISRKDKQGSADKLSDSNGM